MFFFINRLYCISPHTHISRFFVLQKSLYQLPCLKMVAGNIYPHIRNRSHSRNILSRMMAHSQRSVADASADTDQLHICVGISNVHLCLLIASCGKKAGRRNCICFFAALCQSCSNAYQILLCNSCFHKLFRISICKRSKGTAASGITAQSNNIPVCFCRIHQNLTNHLFIGDLTHFSAASFLSSRSFMICSYSSSPGT